MKNTPFLSAALCCALVLADPLAAAARRTDLFGSPVPPGSGYRNIVIDRDTRHVNVEGGELINFIVGDKMFSWNFFVAASVSSFDLNEVAPPSMLDHRVTAYISPDPRYWGRP